MKYDITIITAIPYSLVLCLLGMPLTCRAGPADIIPVESNRHSTDIDIDIPNTLNRITTAHIRSSIFRPGSGAYGSPYAPYWKDNAAIVTPPSTTISTPPSTTTTLSTSILTHAGMYEDTLDPGITFDDYHITFRHMNNTYNGSSGGVEWKYPKRTG